MTTNAIAVAVPTEGRALKAPSVLRCGLLILAIKVILKKHGFGWTMRWMRRRVGSVADNTPGGSGIVRASEWAVAMAGALYPGRALCLEQSLVLYYVLRRRGIAARFRMGVQAHPFASHAWVEYGDEPINDFPEHVKLFTRLPDELP